MREHHAPAPLPRNKWEQKAHLPLPAAKQVLSALLGRQEHDCEERGCGGVSGPVPGWLAATTKQEASSGQNLLGPKSRNPDAGRERYRSVITRVQLVPAGICSSAVAN